MFLEAEQGRGRGVGLVQREAGGRRVGPVGEQPDRVVAGQLLRAGRPGRRQRERRYLPDRLGRHPQGLPAGGDDLQPGRAGQQPLAQTRAGVDQVLAVVQRDQQAAGPQRVRERVEQRHARFLFHPDGRRHRGHHQLGPLQVTKLDEPCAVREVAGQGGQQALQQPGLADPARAAQRDGPHAARELAELMELALPADEAVGLVAPADPPMIDHC